ncbi:hypothetical protein D9613_006112 [Agrocybe pediades]|uniref:Uncharacterized protein n=1 Tax=Agrocybe pediades TaxID=84607 RepID=A0A8H4QVW8_9AGAR|nr:hypothetical protein D9613_006112 [Agrocybe pediades]
MPEGNGLLAVAHVVQDHLKSIPQLRQHLSRQKQAAFALDLTLVACAVRTAYLVDLFSPKNPVELFSDLLTRLRSDKHIGAHFESVFHVYEPSAEQSFIANRTLILQKFRLYHNPEQPSSPINELEGTKATFILLQSPLKILKEPPENVLKLIRTICQVAELSWGTLSFSLCDDSAEALVPLAAIMLDYPVAYVPCMSQNNVLGGRQLDFYEFLLTIDAPNEDWAGEKAHTIMKFSCPAELREESNPSNPSNHLCPEHLKEAMAHMFQTRLRKIKGSSKQVGVLHSTHALSHVSF